jgi:glycosyltransferase involved in cell wall biosynthesis
MLVSMIVSTRDRVQQLRRLFQSVRALSVPRDSQLELVIIDNGSRDGTATYLASAGSSLPPGVSLISFLCQTPGKSRALNLGMRVAKGDIYAFVDDDVILDAGWLAALCAHYENKDVKATQGGVKVLVEGLPPGWLNDRCEALLAATSFWSVGDQVREMVGSNMAVRNDGNLPDFCESIGPGVSNFSMGEDTEWSRRVLSSGRKGTYCPSALVWHDLGGRLRFSEVLKRQFAGGTMRFIFCAPAKRLRFLCSSFISLIYTFLKIPLRYWRNGRDGLVNSALDLSSDLGTLSAYARGATRHPCWRYGCTVATEL